MPAPIPPPPPQPMLEETHRAVRLLRWICAVAVALYAGWTLHYHPDMTVVQHGRYHAQSWTLWKIRTLDASALRSHDGGRIAWLIGSSVLRDAFDEEVINTELAAQNSPWRVAKFAMNRGASGLTVSLFNRLPIQAGDQVIHSVSPDNFRKDWLTSVGLPEDRLLMMMTPSELWQIEEWPFQKRLELALSLPRDFHRYHDEYIAGIAELGSDLWYWKKPRKARPGFHMSYRRLDEMKWLSEALENLEDSTERFDPDELDYSPQQFNIAGLRRLRARCEELGTPLTLLDLPHRELYYTDLLAPEVFETWQRWTAEQPELMSYPRLPEDHFYDFKHPNSSGRRILTATLIEHLASGQVGSQE
ncbi:MAG: hypothetical protein P8R54_28070 [Myxococcota bacterium]|nr:hypothetical protein [Myxococcota bacterium]